MIRPATEADLPDLLGMAERFHAAAFPGETFDAERTGATLAWLLRSGVVFRSEAGMIGGVVMPAWFSARKAEAHEMFWWAEDGAGEALLAAFEAWAGGRGAAVRLSALTALRGAAVGRMLRRRGYRMIETTFAKGGA